MGKKVRKPKVPKVAIPKAYNGIKFDSGLELYCYKKLKEVSLDFEYAKTTFEIIPSFTFNKESYEEDKRTGLELVKKTNKIRNIKYTPDFIGKDWIIETKGVKNESFPIRWKLFKKYLVEQGLKYKLFMPRNQKQVDQCVELIKNKK